MRGYVNSIESFSTLDGPGIRSVVFMQGCPLRCLYCHNPETWEAAVGDPVESSVIVNRVLRNLNYISPNGGVTISGGEPTLQIDFLAELLKDFKNMGLNTAVDTCGYVSAANAEKILEYTDLFIVDIKHMDPLSCIKLTGRSNDKTFRLLELLENANKQVWIRCVMLKGYTDDEEHIRMLHDYAGSFHNVTRIEMLPYHDMAAEKYKKLGIEYKLTVL